MFEIQLQVQLPVGYDRGCAFEGPLPGDTTLGVHGFAVVMTHLNLRGKWNPKAGGSGSIFRTVVEDR